MNQSAGVGQQDPWQLLRGGQLDPVGEALLARLENGALDAQLAGAFLTQALEQQRHDWADAVRQRLEAGFAGDSRAWRLLYQYWRQRTDWARALESIDRVAEREGWSDDLRVGRASLLEKMLRPGEALAELESLGAMAKRWPGTWLVRASAWQQLGESERIIEELGPWLDRTPERNTMVARCWKVLGRELDRRGDHEAAWNAFETGNAMEKAIHQPDLERNTLRLRVAANTTVYTPDWVAQWPPVPPVEHTPAFLVGFPRSGTTLLEQVLDAHPGIQALEEKDCLENAWGYLYPIMIERARARGSYTRNQSQQQRHVAATRELSRLEGSEIQEARRIYFASVRGYLELNPEQLLVDKLPLNLVQIGLIRRLFPGARIMVALRHPCDCILSGYMQGFEMNEAMYNFLDIGDAAGLYAWVMELLRQYEHAFGEDADWHYIRYEDVLADFRGEVGALLDYLGVGWDDAVEHYHEHARNRGTLATPSYQGVTRALYRSAQGRWQHYRSHLEPVFDQLRPACAHLGYSLEIPEEG